MVCLLPLGLGDAANVVFVLAAAAVFVRGGAIPIDALAAQAESPQVLDGPFLANAVDLLPAEAAHAAARFPYADAPGFRHRSAHGGADVAHASILTLRTS